MTKRKSTTKKSKPKAHHTPGPWMYRPNPGSGKEDWTFHVDRQGTPGRPNWGILIAACWGHVSESAEANARLIASAPTLYDVIDRAQARWDDLPNYLRQNGSRVLANMMTETLKELRDALTLADGFEWHGHRDEKGGA